MESNAPTHNQPVHIINIDIQDNHEEATMGAFLICDLASMVSQILATTNPNPKSIKTIILNFL